MSATRISGTFSNLADGSVLTWYQNSYQVSYSATETISHSQLFLSFLQVNPRMKREVDMNRAAHLTKITPKPGRPRGLTRTRSSADTRSLSNFRQSFPRVTTRWCGCAASTTASLPSAQSTRTVAGQTQASGLSRCEIFLPARFWRLSLPTAFRVRRSIWSSRHVALSMILHSSQLRGRRRERSHIDRGAVAAKGFQLLGRHA